MSDPQSTGEDQRAAQVRRVLAEDESIGELGIEVRLDGDVIVLSGQLESAERCAAVERRVREEAPTYRIDNRLVVPAAGCPDGAERLR